MAGLASPGLYPCDGMDATISTLVAQVARLMRRSFDERARTIGVTRPQWQVLSVLSRNPGIKQGGLADMLEVEPITAGRMIDRMQDAQLVERRPDPSDRRAWRLFLTDRGEELFERLQPFIGQTHDVAFEGIEQAELDRVLATLEQIRGNLTRNRVTELAAGD